LKPYVSPDVTDLEISSDEPETKKPVRHRQWGGATVGLLAGLIALMLGRAGHLWPTFDVAAQFGAQALCLVAGFAIAAFLPRFKALFGIFLSGLLVLAYGLWPLIVSNSDAKPVYTVLANERAIKIVQFNTWRYNPDHSAIGDEIERLNGDIVALEEMAPNRSQLLRRLQLRYPYQFTCFQLAECDFAILSKYPIVGASAEGAWDGPPYAKVKLGGDGSGLTFIATHTSRFPHSRAQLRQVQALSKKLEGENAPLIVAGDFNATPFSRITATMEQSTGLKRLTRLPTWPANYLLPQLAIDHIFASPEIRVLVKEKIGNAAGSDHYPIVLTLAVPKP
jgi:endonuclease/exonuclease/phosphatase (EEP) superfamily protein YafD